MPSSPAARTDDYENHWSLAAAHIYSKNFQKGMDSYEKALVSPRRRPSPQSELLQVERATR